MGNMFLCDACQCSKRIYITTHVNHLVTGINTFSLSILLQFKFCYTTHVYYIVHKYLQSPSLHQIAGIFSCLSFLFLFGAGLLLWIYDILWSGSHPDFGRKVKILSTYAIKQSLIHTSSYV